MDRQELRTIKHQARTAATKHDAALALTVCQTIKDHDLFIGESPNLNTAGVAKQITTRYPAMCLECGEAIPLGTRVIWKDNEGCIHLACERGT